MFIFSWLITIDVHKGFGFVDFEEESDAHDAIGKYAIINFI